MNKKVGIALVVIWSCLMVAYFIAYFTEPQDQRDILIFVLQIFSCICGLVVAFLFIRDADKKRYRDIYYAGGCFWGMEKYFKLLKGVIETEVGYVNGNTENPTYEQVYTDSTGYAECVRVRFDTTRTNLRALTEMYFKAIDPTSVNQQGEDKGTRYRTGVYYIDDKSGDGYVLKQVFEEKFRIYGPLAVELLPLKNFVRAEDYHQDYLDKHPQGYCHLSPEIFDIARKSN